MAKQGFLLVCVFAFLLSDGTLASVGRVNQMNTLSPISSAVNEDVVPIDPNDTTAGNQYIHNSRQIVNDMLSTLPAPLTGFIREKWREASSDVPMISALVDPPLQPDQYPKKESDITTAHVVDAAWYVFDDLVQVASRQNLPDIFSQLQSENITKTKPCEFLSQFDMPFAQFITQCANAKSLGQIQLAALSLDRDLNPHFTSPADQLHCITPTTPNQASITHITSQLLSLPETSKSISIILSSTLASSSFLSTLIQIYMNTSPTDGTFSSFLEIEKSHATLQGVHVAAHVCGLAVFIGAAVLLVRVYMQGLHSIQTLVSGKSFLKESMTIDQFVVTIAFSVVILFSIIMLVTAVYRQVSKKGKELGFLSKLGTELRGLKMVNKQKRLVQNIETALKSQNTASPQDHKTIALISRLCELKGFPTTDCSYMDHYTQNKIPELLSAIHNMEDMAISPTMTSQDLDDLRIFQQLFRTSNDHVSSNFVVAKLIELGVPDSKARNVVSRIDENGDGVVNFKEFQRTVIRPETVIYVSLLMKMKSFARFAILFVVALIGQFSTGSENHILFSLILVGVMTLGLLFEMIRVSNLSSLDATTKELRDMQLLNSFSFIVKAALIMVILFLIHTFLMRSCDRPKIVCPNDANIDNSLIDAKVIQDCANNATATECQLIFSPVVPQCVDSIDETCHSRLLCSADGVLFAHLNDKTNDANNKFGIAMYNHIRVDLTEPVDEDSFVTKSMMLYELNEQKSTATNGICVEERSSASVTTVPTNVCRARNGRVEWLTDFGAKVEEKEVVFVEYGSNCPADTVQGTKVNSFEVADSPTDATFVRYGPVQRFQYAVPARTIGKNYFKMCERTGGSGTPWTPVDALYVFGMEAKCGEPDCTNSDFTSKMTRSFMTRLYYTVITATSVGFGDISPASDRERAVICFNAVLMLAMAAMA